jgi:hypothetical protein
MVYFHIPYEKAQKLTELQKSRTHKGGSKDKLAIKIKAGIDRGLSRKVSLVRLLVILMYISATVPLWTVLSPYGDFTFGFRAVSTSVLITLTILVSLAVYSMDKRFLHDYLAGQVIILFILYLIQIVIIGGFFWA